jgi:uncharacterized protein YwgA
MTARDWLLLLIAADGAPDGLDPVRLQKGMFLLAREAPLPPRERYWFVPYNYGPMSPAIYRDADKLVEAGLVEKVSAPGFGWERLAITAEGRERAHELARGDPGATAARLRTVEQVKEEVTRLGFSELLREIYRRYPQFAARSVFDRR